MSPAKIRVRNRNMPHQQVPFFVDSGRTSNGDGSEANPWKERWNIDWAAITTALASGPVTLYFSSRASWTIDGYIEIQANTNSTTNRLILDGASRYNTVASGTAVWQTETSPGVPGSSSGNRASFSHAGGGGGSILIYPNNRYITITGVKVSNGASGGIAIGVGNPSTNLNNILIENCYCLAGASDTAGQGISGVYLESGCSNITLRNNLVENFFAEGLYLGHFNYTATSITGVVIEGNTVKNCGQATGEGDIDVKYPCRGAIVRYNTYFNTTAGNALAAIVIQADEVQCYGNTLFDIGTGDGITLNGDQGGGDPGVTLNDILIYNNLIYTADGSGITLHANDPTGEGSGIVNLKILNNTIVSNGATGIRATASGGCTITISELYNNIFANNAGRQVDIADAGGTITAANNNLYFGSAPLLRYQGVDKTFGQWQALGFDANGVNADPDLNASYVPNGGSPALGAGSTQTEFTVDKNQVTRSVPWDIGCFEA